MKRPFRIALSMGVLGLALVHGARGVDVVPDSGRVDAVRHLGPQFLNNQVGVTGADGATSLVLPNGVALWVFGDTVEGPFQSIRGLELKGLRSNTAALVPPQDLAGGVRKFRFLADPSSADSGRPRPRQIVPFADDEDPAVHRVWAIHGTCVGDRAYLFYHRITLLKEVDVFVNFRLDGMGIARGDLQNLEFQRLRAPDGTREFWKPAEPTFGVFVEKRDEFCYLWGSLLTGMYLARVRPNAIEDLRAYEYLVEAPSPQRPDVMPRWSPEFKPTATLFDNVPNEMSAGFNAYLGKYVAIHAYGRAGIIALRTAPTIVGPWSAPEAIYRAAPQGDLEFVYAAKEHPELAADAGRRIYLTFVDSSTYIPQLVEVVLRK